MRYSLILPAFCSIVSGLPSPQNLNFNLIDAAPDPIVSQSFGLTQQLVSYDSTAIFAEATAAATSVSIAVSDVLSGTAIVSQSEATPTLINNDERDLDARAACTPLPTGVADYALSLDTAFDFRSNGSWASMASQAPVPSGYVNTVLNAAGANRAYGFLGYYNLPSYDSSACAAKCSTTIGCMAFNIYFERDPSLDPGAGTTGCADPSSVVYAKCALWGGELTTGNAVYTGTTVNQFEIAVAGSNAYQNNSLTTPAGYTLNGAYNNASINAPFDILGSNTFLGSTIFTKGPFNIQICADFCSAQTRYNFAHPAKDGTPPKACSFFNTYILYKNSASTPQGQYCTLYSEVWDDSYARPADQWRGSDHYFVGYSYTFSNSTNPGVNPTVGDVKAAAFQARQDMTYFPTSLTSVFQPYCSSLLGYTQPVTTSTPLVTVTITLLTTVASVWTVTAFAKRDATVAADRTTLRSPLIWLTSGALNQKRGLATPAVLTKYPVAVQSSACSLIMTQAISASTSTAATTTTTVTLAIQTSIATSYTTVQAAPAADPTGILQVQNVNSPYNGLYVTFSTSMTAKGNPTLIVFTNDTTQAGSWTIDKTNSTLFSSDRSVAAAQVPYDKGDKSVRDDYVAVANSGLITKSQLPLPVCSVTAGTLSCIGGSPNDQRVVMQICPGAEKLGGGVFGSGGFLILSSRLGDGCNDADLAWISS
ncbi:hypothetical protein E4T45_02131 [Aureobasidium sp. EXF-8846]|jgi:hypothetical protein|nr:hypothetical protein E4T45_02131 [Aureobasidium sp. EXF-8846]